MPKFIFKKKNSALNTKLKLYIFNKGLIFPFQKYFAIPAFEFNPKKKNLCFSLSSFIAEAVRRMPYLCENFVEHPISPMPHNFKKYAKNVGNCERQFFFCLLGLSLRRGTWLTILNSISNQRRKQGSRW